ncbi:MAG: low affinity iron permease family protein [Deltaproteobacteria bacterium]|nr:low affinity iron permease family protein [Deltaproteobacteria bacterium]
MTGVTSHELFRRIAKRISYTVGSPIVCLLAVVLVVGWAIAGPFFGYSDTWQLAINTTTTIITFLMVFLIQNTQNRDSKEIHLKLDELIHAMKKARNSMLDVEDMPDAELARLEGEFRKEAKQRTRERHGLRDDDRA